MCMYVFDHNFVCKLSYLTPCSGRTYEYLPTRLNGTRNSHQPRVKRTCMDPNKGSKSSSSSSGSVFYSWEESSSLNEISSSFLIGAIRAESVLSFTANLIFFRFLFPIITYHKRWFGGENFLQIVFNLFGVFMCKCERESMYVSEYLGMD